VTFYGFVIKLNTH